MSDTNDPSDSRRNMASATDSAAPLLDGEALLQGRKEVRIAFQDQVYRLSVTGNGKLILTK
ncbi:hemin uptake protein HemP [Tepidamorphus sp. 3E244]|uniref:hemin uptake protein HemP n=1 Tax=Tepidamorphus sp. 3E244 TaxID=3385498 RepID=UPI0038FC099D